jgi:hypothetical protein
MVERGRDRLETGERGPEIREAARVVGVVGGGGAFAASPVSSAMSSAASRPSPRRRTPRRRKIAAISASWNRSGKASSGGVSASAGARLLSDAASWTRSQWIASGCRPNA